MQTGNTAGRVTLRSKDPRDPLNVKFNDFEEQGERDLKALSECAEYVLEVMDAVGPPYLNDGYHPDSGNKRGAGYNGPSLWPPRHFNLSNGA